LRPPRPYLLLSLKGSATEAENFEQEAMSTDFAALTEAVVAGLSEVRSCVMVSRDGLALGAYPATEEGRTLDVWTRLAALGDVERGFMTVRDEIWVFCRRGAYGAVATAASTARPGVILDSLEQMVLAAEEARVRKEGIRPPAERSAPAPAETPRGMRTPLHKERAAEAPSEEDVIKVEDQEAAVVAWTKRILGREGSGSSDGPEASDAVASTEAGTTPAVTAERGRERSADDAPVDPVELGREFAGILAEHEEEDS
jgi:hypothetical protein